MQELAKRLGVLPAGVGLILLTPLAAMQFSNDVVWTPRDFIAAGVLLFGAGLAYVLITTQTRARRLPVAVVITGLFLLVWAQLAVGIFDAPFAGS